MKFCLAYYDAITNISKNGIEYESMSLCILRFFHYFSRIRREEMRLQWTLGSPERHKYERGIIRRLGELYNLLNARNAMASLQSLQ